MPDWFQARVSRWRRLCSSAMEHHRGTIPQPSLVFYATILGLNAFHDFSRTCFNLQRAAEPAPDRAGRSADRVARIFALPSLASSHLSVLENPMRAQEGGRYKQFKEAGWLVSSLCTAITSSATTNS